nr:hypothetical protein Iba_chr06aCG8700 [Ipomoea batatas]
MSCCTDYSKLKPQTEGKDSTCYKNKKKMTNAKGKSCRHSLLSSSKNVPFPCQQLRKVENKTNRISKSPYCNRRREVRTLKSSLSAFQPHSFFIALLLLFGVYSFITRAAVAGGRQYAELPGGRSTVEIGGSILLHHTGLKHHTEQ